MKNAIHYLFIVFVIMNQLHIYGSSPYESFSTGPDYVLLNIRAPERSNAIVVIENPESYLLFLKYNVGADKKDYIIFMKRGSVLDISNSDFDHLLKTSSGMSDEIYTKDSKLSRKELLEKYTTKITKDGLREIKQLDGLNTNMVIRMLIELGLRVHRDCESGLLLCSEND